MFSQHTIKPSSQYHKKLPVQHIKCKYKLCKIEKKEISFSFLLHFMSDRIQRKSWLIYQLFVSMSLNLPGSAARGKILHFASEMTFDWISKMRHMILLHPYDHDREEMSSGQSLPPQLSGNVFQVYQKTICFPPNGQMKELTKNFCHVAGVSEGFALDLQKQIGDFL